MKIRIQVTKKPGLLDEYSIDVEAGDFHDAVWKAKEDLLSRFEFKSLGVIRKK